jgi:hypothetical protein
MIKKFQALASKQNILKLKWNRATIPMMMKTMIARLFRADPFLQTNQANKNFA